MKRKTLITSILVIVVCLALISGSTYSLFTSESSVNIAVTSGKVEVVATIDPDSLKVYSATADTTGLTDAEKADVAGTLTGTFAGTYYYDKLDGTTFTNGGTVELTDTKTLKINKITPGDKVEVTVSVENNSNVKTKYRIRVNVLDGTTIKEAAESLKLFEGLTVNVGTNDAVTRTATTLDGVIRASNWYQLDAREANSTDNFADVPVEIFLPLDAGNEYQNLKTEIQITVEAVQSNASTALLDSINGILRASAEKNNTMYEAIQEVVADTQTEFTATDLYGFVWSVDDDLFYAETDVEESFEYKYFKAYTQTEYATLAKQTFSVYAYGTGWITVDDIKVGFDAGETSGITSVTYDRSTATYGQEVVIRTNGGALTINAPKDVVRHYGTAGTLNIIAAANASYHEHGQVAFAEIATGRFVLEHGSDVDHLHFTATQGNFNDITVAKDANVDMPEFSRDPVVIPEEGKLVVALQKGTNEDDDKDYVWLTAVGIYEQVTVSDSDTQAKDNYAATSTTVTQEQQTAAQQIANNITFSNNSVDYKVTATKSGDVWTYEVKTKAGADASASYTATASGNTVTVQTTGANPEEVQTTVENGLSSEQKQTAKNTIIDAVARIENNYYATFAAAYSAALPTDTIYILKDFTLNSVVVLDKNTTIKGQNHEIKSSANRIFRVSQPNIDVKIYDFVMTSTCTVGEDERGISFDNTSSNSSLLLDNCILSAEFYTINAIPGADNLTVTINNGTVAAGWAAINTYSRNSTFTIKNSTLRGLNDKGESSWNNFNTITIDGNGLWSSSANNGSNNTVNIINSTVYSDSNNNNRQYWVGLQYGALNNTVNVDSDSRIINSDGDDLTDNFFVGWYHNYIDGSFRSYYDNSSNKIIVANEEKEFFTPDVYYHWSVGNLYKGVGIAFEDPFTTGLEDGEFITLLRNVTLNNDVTVPFENGVFYLTLGDYTITGDGLINLPQGVTLITDKAIDSLLVNPDGFEIIKSQIENGYSYKVSALKGSGTQENPFQIYDYATMQKVSEYYDLGYYYFEVALDKTENGAIDCANMWTAVNINGSFDGKGVVFNNLNNQLFRSVGKAPSDDIYTIKNITINANININGYGAAAIRQAGNNLVLDNVTVHGYIEGNNGASAFVCFGPGNIASSNSNAQPMNWTFRNCYSDATVVATGDVAVGFVKHPYCYASQQGGNATAQASCLLTIVDSIFKGKLSYVGTGVYSKKYFVGNANDMLVKTVYSNEFIAQYGNPEGTLYATPTAKTDDGIFFIGNYPGEGKKISGYTEYGTCVDTYLGTSAFLTVTAGSLPAKYETFTISKVENAVSAKVTLEIAPNGTNETGSYLGTFMSETINLENVSDTFSTSEIKYFDITINGDSTNVTGISADGKTFNIVGTNYGTTFNGAKLRVSQYDSNGNVINITTYTFANN